MITASAYLCADRDPNDPIIRPRALLHLLGIGHPDLTMLAEALANDVVEIAPMIASVSVRLTQQDETGQAERATTASAVPTMEIVIGDPKRSQRNVVLRLPAGHVLKSAEHNAIMWAITLADRVLDRRALNQLESARQSADARFEATFQHAPVGIAHVSIKGDFLLVNDHFLTITGRSREYLMENGFQAITHPDDLDADLAYVGHLLAGKGDRYMIEKRYIRADDSVVWVNLTVAVVRDRDGTPDYFVSVIEDLSEMKRAKADATRDPLTGLFNRRGLRERLRRELARAVKTNAPMTVVYLDLDDFKGVNDQFGHAAGDACLIAVADALVKATRPADTIARIGGDEFVLLMPDPDMDDDLIIERLKAALMVAGVDLGHPIGGSFGAVNTSRHDRAVAETLIAEADQAMFRAKRARHAAQAR